MIREFKRYCKRTSRKIAPWIISYPVLGLLRILLSTCQIHIEGIDRFVSLASQERCILMLWHNRLALVAYILHQYAPQFMYAAFISKSKDGDLLATVANSYPQGKAIRIAHHAKFNALREMIRQLKAGRDVILMTPDGPRGPKYRIKPGIVLAAQSTQAHVIPFTWSADRFWQLKTWDHLIIPKPFSKVVISLGEPIHLEDDAADCLSTSTFILQQALNDLNRKVCKTLSPEESTWPK